VKRFLLDTGPAQQFLNNRMGIRQRADEERRHGHRIGICTPVLGELWSGVEGSQSRDQNLRRLRHGLSRLVIWPYDEVAAAEYGRVFTELKRIGRPMQQIDIQIAAVAFALGECVVVTADSDLSAVPGLDVEDCSVPRASA
jgi:tRNA(fMet)-specific endonuclease VapC